MTPRASARKVWFLRNVLYLAACFWRLGVMLRRRHQLSVSSVVYHASMDEVDEGSSDLPDKQAEALEK